eukprot:m51a1_g11319 putative 1-phosphatidylinositol -bisphosphate phosphodiesterase delta-4-like (789) ;mRNA; f:110291-113404
MSTAVQPPAQEREPAAPPAAAPVQGWLELRRQGAVRAQWKRRWAVLDRDAFCVRLYASDSDGGAKARRFSGRFRSSHSGSAARGAQPPRDTIDLRPAIRSRVGDGKKKSFIIEFDKCQYELAAASQLDRDRWHSEISLLFQDSPPISKEALELFNKHDKDASGTLEFDEIQSLLKEMNVSASVSSMRTKFAEVDVDRNGKLNFREFEMLLENLRRDAVVGAEFEAAGGDRRLCLSHRRLLHYVREQQHLRQAKSDLTKRIIALYPPRSAVVPQDRMDLWGFGRWLVSTEGECSNTLFDDATSQAQMDMGRPLTEYFIASSHNTYLMGDQLRGESSVLAYRNALEKGCRCVELDTWDGQSGMPIITHGHTFTSKISFVDVITCVRDCAFRMSPYPVILSIENHCCLQQQDVMAQVLEDVLGGAGMLPSVDEFRRFVEAPTPTSLKNKVIIKGKTLSGADAAPESDSDTDSDDVEVVSLAQPLDKDKDRAGSKQDKPPEKPAKKPKIKVSKRLSDLTHLSTYSFPKTPKAAAVSAARKEAVATGAIGRKEATPEMRPFWSMCSFSEVKVNKMIAAGRAGYLRQYNAAHITRTYPKGTRFASSNYDPCPAWSAGCHLVALNYQTSSTPMWINEAFFRLNGGCGYVLKPQWMCERAHETPAPAAPACRLVVEVLCARQLPRPAEGEIADPYVVVSTHGLPEDCKEFRTKVLPNNGWDPVWNERFEFTLRAPEISVMLVTVWDKGRVSDTLIARYAVALPLCRRGVRSVPLYDPKGAPCAGAYLLCRVNIEHP